MFKKILTTLFGLSIIIGFVVVLGTAGFSDTYLIDFKTSSLHSVIGLLLTLAGFIGIEFTNMVFFLYECGK